MNELVDGLFQLSFRLQGRLARIAAGRELSLVQLRLLAILRDREPLMQELARHLELTKSSLSGLIDRAESRGLVQRVTSREDKRASAVKLTAKGKQLARAIESEVERDAAALLEVLPPGERAQLAKLISLLLRV